MKIAIIGSGISGMTCAYLLQKKHDITVFESANYIGGHTNTIDVVEDDRTLAIDTGFIVFNKKTYPNFVKLMEQLKVSYQATSMSFSVKCGRTGFEYNGTSLNSLFAQRGNLFNPRMYRVIAGILKFNKAAKDYLKRQDQETSLRQFATEAKLNHEVIHDYLIPMAASVWSADPRQMWDFPALFMLRFWENHGFLEINERPLWYVINCGSRSYIEPLTRTYRQHIRLSTAVTSVKRLGGKVSITSRSIAGGASAAESIEEYDAVVFATHSDQALKMLADPSANEQRLLSSIPFLRNMAVLHTDTHVLPRSKRAWGAWNYFIGPKESNLPTLTYNMNILQSLDTKSIYNVSLNPPFAIAAEKVIKTIEYHHPVFTLEGMVEQKRYDTFIGEKNTYFAGAWLRNGFHEDGVVSALKVCAQLGETL